VRRGSRSRPARWRDIDARIAQLDAAFPGKPEDRARRLGRHRAAGRGRSAPIRYVAEIVAGNTEPTIRSLIAFMLLCCDPLAIALTAAESAGQSRETSLTMDVICWIAHELKADRLIRVVTLKVAITPDWKAIRHQGLLVWSSGPPSRPGAQD
jgi:hypothetical protein